MRARLTVLLLSAALVGCASGEAPDPGSPPPSAGYRSPFFSVNANVLFTRLVEERGSLLEPQLAQIAAAPISAVRASVDWRRVEPAPPTGPRHVYDFSSHDPWVAALARHGLRWTPTIIGLPVPTWAADPEVRVNCGSRSPPRDPAEFAAFAGAFAERYGSGGEFWRERPELPHLPVERYEIWNEPNHGAFWCPAPHAAAFAGLLRAAAAAVRTADPAAEIVLGGLAPFPESEPEAQPPYLSLADYAEALADVDSGLPEVIDAVGIHTYGPDAESAFATVVAARDAIDAAGFDELPIDVNEAGWPTQGIVGGFSVIADEATRAGELAALAERVFAARRELRIAGFAPYTWVSESIDPTDQEHWFGLADPATGAPYPAAEAYRETVERLSTPP